MHILFDINLNKNTKYVMTLIQIVLYAFLINHCNIKQKESVYITTSLKINCLPIVEEDIRIVSKCIGKC